MEYTVAVSEIAREFSLLHLNETVSTADKSISYAEINRPALQLTGFFDYFDSERLQIIGIVEYSYLEKLDAKLRYDRLKRVFEYKIPCIVICRGLKPFPELLQLATESAVPIFSTELSTTDFMGEIIRWLKVQLAPRVTVHGVFVDVFGEGVLIMGESGIGKSETALELIKRGHRFIADDAVEIKRVSHSTLLGSCPELIRYFIELRGIGIIDVMQMFGVESIKATQSVDLVIKLEAWDKTKEYDRLGLTENFTDILGNKITCHEIPIRPGRNVALICESAAINYRQKKMGYNAAKVLNDRVMSNMV